MFFNNQIFAGVDKSEVIALDANTGDIVRKYSIAVDHVYGLVVLPGRKFLHFALFNMMMRLIFSSERLNLSLKQLTCATVIFFVNVLEFR